MRVAAVFLILIAIAGVIALQPGTVDRIKGFTADSDRPSSSAKAPEPAPLKSTDINPQQVALDASQGVVRIEKDRLIGSFDQGVITVINQELERRGLGGNTVAIACRDADKSSRHQLPWPPPEGRFKIDLEARLDDEVMCTLDASDGRPLIDLQVVGVE